MRVFVYILSILTFLIGTSGLSQISCIELFVGSRSFPVIKTKTPPGSGPKKSQQGFLNIGAQKMFYRLDVPPGLTRKPKDEVYLLIHGLLAHSGYLDGVAEKLMAEGKTVLRVDLFGHGKSLLNSKISSGSIEDQAYAISQILYHLNISQITIYGHSLGGGVAMQTTVMAPEVLMGRVQIRHLIIDEPYIYPVDRWMYEQSGLNMMSSQAFNPYNLIDFFIGAAASTDSVRGKFAAGLEQAIRQYPKYFSTAELSPGDQAKGAVSVFPSEDLTTLASRIKIPVTLIRGRFDAMVAPMSLMDAIPGFFGRTITVREVKTTDPHHHPFNSPEKISEIILASPN